MRPDTILRPQRVEQLFSRKTYGVRQSGWTRKPHSVTAIFDTGPKKPDQFEHSRHFQILQALRFVAAALVVYAHAVDWAIYNGLRPYIAETRMENVGAIGVDLFFVISGFIITLTAARARAPGQFLRDRFLRVAPVYWLLSIPAVIISMMTVGLSPARVLTTALFWPVWGRFAPPYLAVGWTLSFEMLFYACVGLTLWRIRWQWLIGAYVLLLLANFVAPNSIVRFLGNPIILEFLFGVLIAKAGPRTLGGPALLAGLICFGCVVVIGDNRISEVEYTVSGELALTRVLQWGIPAALVIYGGVNLDRDMQRGLPWMLLGKLGDASYSLYLSHIYVLRMASPLAARLLPGCDTTLLTTALAVAVGCLVYRFIEQPLRTRLRARFIAPAPRVSAG